MNQRFKVEKTLTINKPVEELYHFWRNFDNLPRFIKYLKEVRVHDEKLSHWISKGFLNGSVEWDVVITEDRENELIAWTSVEGAAIETSGRVHFKPAPGNRGTEVKTVREFTPPGGAIGAALAFAERLVEKPVIDIAKLFGEDPELEIKEDLRRFRMLMEAGEIATTEGQPQG
ncbi:cyclase [Nostoc linckia z18]|uniref:Cyclase n=3 Tax=Nostoc linckia TaxID=92942 RepID=A0A9Q5Z7R4_NOSLI|nr:cyclase [Nostoc linckia z1]PHJ58113.1 cyclase [Nostoc linckia z3]PHJ60653.1 cyclase [Nostoc linckia z2]PHJ74653.1 cyclase [Nostoc linckia z4]PHJ78201.1 cyclase [Nostoc linckia z6]PHJ91838.1 cyclase [Nostoc linckia z7]PHJ98240.1 cyclase [Nostoc linckia z8]PHK06841.1 cyclase [Nostoc linckia z9]PHK16698.1 cyclase [Nostoc linckia z14]PHK20764.1 cyclase [Nostoc linckia z13]PHK30558.1 cyclase [Nostoc linckia z18]PHK38818.1 cyclase [Nostoc linckia z15]PHK43489.1 cyclase [Nostoc linckia z16]